MVVCNKVLVIDGISKATRCTGSMSMLCYCPASCTAILASDQHGQKCAKTASSTWQDNNWNAGRMVCPLHGCLSQLTEIILLALSCCACLVVYERNFCVHLVEARSTLQWPITIGRGSYYHFQELDCSERVYLWYLFSVTYINTPTPSAPLTER